MTDYHQFIEEKSQIGRNDGFAPTWMPDFLFPFQAKLCDWSIRKGRAAKFADCGLGKTPMQLVWSQNVVEHSNKPVLVLAPLGVTGQTVREGEKFGVECFHSRDGKFPATAKTIVTNYQRLHYFDWQQFSGAVCDESSILKNFDGQIKESVTEFMRKLKYRLLCTATAAPNDYIELGTTSEALGDLGYMDMLGRFFKASDSASAHGGSNHGRFNKNPFQGKFRFRGHSEHDFWRWVCSWARAIRKPSDLGFEDGDFKLPELITTQHVVKANKLKPGMLFSLPAHGLSEQREERRRTLEERCEKAAQLVIDNPGQSLSWTTLNDEADMMENLIPGSVQVCGSDDDEFKEESFLAFSKGEIQNLVTKSVIAGFGLNFQNCAHQTHFPSNSFEQWYQAIRRSWRFGQKNSVTIDMVTSEGQASELQNLQRKAALAETMFDRLVSLMNNELQISQSSKFTKQLSAPSWL